MDAATGAVAEAVCLETSLAFTAGARNMARPAADKRRMFKMCSLSNVLTSGLQETEQVRVESIPMRKPEAVRCALVDFELRRRQHLRDDGRRDCDGNDLIVRAVNDQ